MERNIVIVERNLRFNFPEADFGGTNIAPESTRKWRNRNIAEYLDVGYQSEDQLVGELKRRFPRLKDPDAFLRMDTGITHHLDHYGVRP